MADWREIHGDQNLRMAQKMLEQQGEINRLTAGNANLIRNAEILADEVIHANADLAAAEARGRQQGHTEMIEALRDTEAYFRWTHRIPGLVGTIHAPGLEVDYLEAVAAWITKDVEHTTEGSR